MNRIAIENIKQYYQENKRIVVDTVVLLVAILSTGFYLSYVEATETFYEFSRQHEELELDDIALTIAVSSLYLSLYTLRRFFDLKMMMVQAYTDPLMGIVNRRRGVSLIKNEINRSNSHGVLSSIVMFDIDNFKQVNDTYGHDVGDYVLQEICNLTQHQIRESDVFIRWGGEEFIILCRRSTLEQAFQLAERLRYSIAEYDFKGIAQVTASFGVSEISQEEGLNTLLNRVDKRLYQSKRSGKNKVTSCYATT